MSILIPERCKNCSLFTRAGVSYICSKKKEPVNEITDKECPLNNYKSEGYIDVTTLKG